MKPRSGEASTNLKRQVRWSYICTVPGKICLFRSLVARGIHYIGCLPTACVSTAIMTGRVAILIRRGMKSVRLKSNYPDSRR
jgi:hypothetical protein